MEVRKCDYCHKTLPSGTHKRRKYCKDSHCKTRAYEKRRGIKNNYKGIVPKKATSLPASTKLSIAGGDERLELLKANLNYWETIYQDARNGKFYFATIGLGALGSFFGADNKVDQAIGIALGAGIGHLIDKNRKEQIIADALQQINFLKSQIQEQKQIKKITSAAVQQLQLVKPDMITREKNYTVINSLDMSKIKRDTYKMSDKWKFFLGNEIEKSFTALIHGKPKNGKTHLAIQMAQYFNNKFGGVVYFSGEEGAAKTIQDKLEKWNATFDVVYNINGYRGIDDYLKKYNPKFIFIDSLTRLGITADSVKYFVDEYQDRSWVMITQSTKGNSHKGSQELTHFVDSVISVSDGVASQNGRTVVGETELPVFGR